MNRAQSRIRLETGEEEWGFVQDTGTRNTIFMVIMLSEWTIEMQKYPNVIDYTKAFNKIKHEEFLKMLLKFHPQVYEYFIICIGN